LLLPVVSTGCGESSATKSLQEAQAARVQDLVKERDEARSRAADLQRALDESKETAGRLEREKAEALTRVQVAVKERDDALARVRSQVNVAPTVPSPVGAAVGAGTRFLYANSLCRYPMRILVHHRDSQSPHHTHAWYSFRPYAESRLEANGVVLRQTDGESLFVYAETVPGPGVPSLVWSGNDARTTVNGVNYNLRRLSANLNSRGELEFQFTCSN
jgi:hypothetical protein